MKKLLELFAFFFRFKNVWLIVDQDGNSGVVEGATSVSLLLVELVSPDVMYNGLPWPDEDFTKVLFLFWYKLKYISVVSQVC